MNKTTHDNILKAHCFKNLSATDYLVPYKNMNELLRERASGKSDKIYITFYDADSGKVSLTYRDFMQRVNQLANFLIENGIGRGDRVATFSHNHFKTVILYFASWAVGAVVVPVNVSEEIHRVGYILEH